MTFVAPSILAADYLKLGEEIKKVEQAGVDYLHIDIMDGHFVPNLTFGIDMVAQISKATTVPLDVHLMLTNPEQYIEKVAESGASIISVHFEACNHIHYIIQEIKKAGCKAGVVLNPGTAVSNLNTIIQDVDLVLQMTVNPGFGGQAFIPSALNNILCLNELRKNTQSEFLIQVDGGINLETAKLCKEVGADFFVAGSYLFGSEDIQNAVQELKNIR